MLTAAWGALLLIGVAAIWLAWRYFRLVRGIRIYEKAFLDDRIPANAPESELVDLGRAFHLFAQGRAGELSALRFELERLAAVLDQMTDGVLIVDPDGKVRFSNPAAADLFQSPNPRGLSVTQVIRNHRLVEAWQRSRELGGLQSESAEIPTTRQFLQLIVIPDAHSGGSLLLVQDLTRIRRLETVRQDFVSNLSHELRTPLASLKALAETLQGGALHDPQVVEGFLARIVTEVDSLAQMSEELLELSAIESGKAVLRLETLNPKALLEVAAERMRMQAERGGIAMQVEAPDGLPEVRADPGQLEQVLVNLIHNAIKFTPPGGTVVLSAGPPGPATDGTGPSAARAVQFSVRDTGRGIAAEDVPRIFERFFRGDKARSSGGTGLGLSISRHIVEAHGGRIWVESLEGHGSTFFFTIPRAS
jgi:two-component system phosphate regulon sensor histidine kinase PhoR